MICIKIIYFLLTQTTCTTVVVFEPRGQGSQILFDACINQIGVEIHLATVTVCDCECQCHSLSVDSIFARWRARPGADFVQDIVVAKGKDLVVRGIYSVARHSV